MFKAAKIFLLYYLVFSFIIAVPILAQNNQVAGKRPLTRNDYDAWKSINNPQISVDGKWIVYLETPQKGDAELVALNPDQNIDYHHVIGYSGEGTNAEDAANPQITYNSSHVIFLISQTKAEVDSVKKVKKESKKNDKNKPAKTLAIMNLADGSITTIDSVKSFKLPEEAVGWVAYLKEEPKKKEKKEDKNEEMKSEEGKVKGEKEEDEKEKKDEKKKDYGTELILQSLSDTTRTAFESVLDFRFTKNGKYLLYIVSSKEKPQTDGVYSNIPGDTTSTPLLTGKGNYKGWEFDKKETRMAFFTDRDDYESKKPIFNLYGWNVGNKKAKLWISHTSTKEIPAGMAVSEKSNLSFSEDGKVLMLGIKEIPDTTKREDDDEEKAKFDLWHWNDPYPQPQQKKMADRVRDDAWESLYFIDSKKFVKLADEKIPDVRLSRDGKMAYAVNPWPYTKRVSYEGTYNDIYEIDPKTGERTLAKKELFGGANISPNNKYLYWFENNNWFVYNVKTNDTTNITGRLNVRFDREDWDTPEPSRPYGIAGWTNGDKSVLIYDRYDIWEINPDGSNAHNITEDSGRKNNLSFRYIDLDPDEVTINPDKTILLAATNEETMVSGFYRDKVNGNALPTKLIMTDKSFGRRPFKAKKTDRLLFTRSSFDEFPDLWVSDLDFKNLKKITDLGKQMEPFIWGKAELRAFHSADGKPLKGILIKPDNFDPNQKYPLMVYIYETLHGGLHRFSNPSPGTSVNAAYYVSNGYVMWLPDIEYGTGYPGKDALKCVLPGVQMLIREGYIDPERIGIQGHSWGGYQVAYMVTQTNIFAAAEAGAPVSNMVSAYDGIRWGSGMVRQFQYERTQSRLGASLWEVPMRYIENSPIFWADKVQTPLLMIHNDEDGAVPWYQGIEYMMALRRLSKEAYMFNYNGEEHGLRKRINQEDWTIRMQEFFDHHLKGSPAPEWMKNGIKAWEKEDEKKEN
jgi:dipeptidyl aminopeptidase/acylaminoacyl peptidase